MEELEASQALLSMGTAPTDPPASNTRRPVFMRATTNNARSLHALHTYAPVSAGLKPSRRRKSKSG
eukprot:scaffold195916_cov34-Tisochrysis_lutea.AAC.4